MKLDSAEVLASAAACTPLRVGAVWGAAGLGAVAPTIGMSGADLGAAVWIMILCPFYLLIVALSSGWWSLVAVPFLLGLTYQATFYVVQDRPRDQLWGIAGLSGLVCLRTVGSAWYYVLAFGLTLYGVGVIQRHREIQSELREGEC